MKVFFILNLLFLVIISSSCSRTTNLVNISEKSEIYIKLNYLGENRTGYINTNSGIIIETKYLESNKDTLSYMIINSDSLLYIPSDSINHVYFKDHFVGAMDGILVGELVGIYMFDITRFI